MQCRQKTVVFGWHRDLIEDLAFKLRQAGRGVATLIGGTKEPDKLVERFQNDSSIQYFLGNLDCASTSITLTEAHHLVLAEQSCLAMMAACLSNNKPGWMAGLFRCCDHNRWDKTYFNRLLHSL
jgi:hypothetical protein